MNSKKGAMEMSMGTIVTIVLLMSVLILGLVFVRNIMCSGITLTDKITQNTENELQNLFGAKDYGVICQGDPGTELTLGDGGTRRVYCMINTNEQSEYSLTVSDVSSLTGTTTDKVNKWIISQGFDGSVKPGKSTVGVLTLNIPKDISDTTLEITLDEENKETGSTQTHTMQIKVTHVGTLTSAIC